MVTSNLDQVSRGLRLPIAKRLLQADAACIDWKNNLEKAQQVLFMAPIFRNGKRVQAWVS
jgi:hypothetical protein